MGRKTIERGISYDDEKKRYYVLLSTGTDADGQSTKRYETVRTITEARAIRKEHKKQVLQGRVLPASRDTLVERSEQYIQYKSMQLQAITTYGYNNIVKNRIKLHFKKKKIRDIKVTDLRAYVIAKSKAGLSNTTIRRRLDLLNSIFDAAKKERVIMENPLDFMDAVVSDTKEKEFYTPEETAVLLNSLKDSQIKVAVYLAVCLGLRRGEVLGLRWEDVALENGVIYIKNTRTQAGSQVIEKNPKTESGHRKMAIVQLLYDVLRQEKERQPVKQSMQRSRYIVSMS